MDMARDFAGRILGLKPKVICVQLQEQPQGKILTKIINTNNPDQFTTSNDAACMMLYLMMQDRREEVHFDELVDFAKNQYDLDDSKAKVAVNEFLNELDGHKLLWDRPGTSSGTNPDQLGLYGPISTQKPPWPGGPYLTSGGANQVTVVGENTVFTKNYYRIIYRP